MPRAVKPEAHLVAAREALAGGAFAVTLREAWSAASAAARIGDETALREVLELTSTLTSAGVNNAEQLHVYATACLEDAQKGTRPPSALERLLGHDRRPR